jgi:hypothetical protein
MTPAFLDALVAPLWVGANLALGVASHRLACRLFPSDDLLTRVLHTLVVALAWVVALCLTLGALGLLRGWILLLLGGGIPALALALKWLPASSSPATLPAEGTSRTAVVLLGVWALLASFAIAYVFTHSLLVLPADWDSLMYHLPLIDYWLQAGGLYAPGCRQWSVPGNNELVGVWLAAPFTGDFLVGLTNLLATAILALAAREVARVVGASPLLADATGIGAVMTMVVRHQLADTENDVALAGLFTAALAYGTRYAHSQRREDLLLMGICAGLLAGVKYSAPGYTAVVSATGIGMAAMGLGRRGAIAATVALALGILLWGSYWYARNFLLTGTPLYPMGATSNNDIMFQQYPAPLWHSSFLGSGRPEVLRFVLPALWQKASPLHVVGVVAAPLSLAWLIGTGFLFHRRAAAPAGAARLGLGAALAGAGFILLITPYAIEDRPDTLNHLRWAYTPVRYGLSFLTLSVVALALVAQDWVGLASRFAGRARIPSAVPQGTRNSRWARWVTHLPAAAVATAAAYRALVLYAGSSPAAAGWETVIAAASLFLLGGAVALILVTFSGTRRLLRAGLAVVLSLGAGLAVPALANHWHRLFGPYYDTLYGGPLLSTSRTSAWQGNGRVCVLVPMVYPFFGSARQVPLCQPVWVPSYAGLLDYLREQRAAFVVTEEIRPDASAGPHRYRNVYGWLTAHEEQFTQVASTDVTFIFRFHPSALAGGAGGADATIAFLSASSADRGLVGQQTLRRPNRTLRAAADRLTAPGVVADLNPRLAVQTLAGSAPGFARLARQQPRPYWFAPLTCPWRGRSGWGRGAAAVGYASRIRRPRGDRAALAPPRRSRAPPTRLQSGRNRTQLMPQVSDLTVLRRSTKTTVRDSAVLSPT